MTRFDFLKASAIGALATALLAAALPAQAQERGRGGFGQRGERVERVQRPSVSQDSSRGNRGGSRKSAAPQSRSSERPAMPSARAQAGAERTQTEARAAQARAVFNRAYGGDRSASYTSPRDRSYGATTRNRDSQAERQARAAAPQGQRSPGRGDGVRGDGVRGDGDRGTFRQGYIQGRRVDARDDRRDEQRAYNRGYSAADRSDHRYGRDHRRWDNRGWRNDRRYDWYRYRASNRSIFSPGRYYAPYRGYNYSRISIGFRLGSPFYSNRYWINDPWQYRLPNAYGPYRWVRYYDDALLVDTYSGEVVDVIHDFFW